MRSPLRRAAAIPAAVLSRGVRPRLRRWTLWRTLRQRRRDDLERLARARSENERAVAADASRGSVGWFIAVESRYSPVRDRGPAANSPLSPKPRLTNSGGDKMGFDRNGYAEPYAAILARWLDSDPTFVELGIFMGSSLALWCDLFPTGRIIGLDVSLEAYEEHRPRLVERGAFARNAPVVRTFDAFAPDPTVLEALLGGRTIDVFVDDGPHKELPSCLTAAAVRPLLSDRFTYIVEDSAEIYPCLRETFAGCRVEDTGRGLIVITEA